MLTIGCHLSAAKGFEAMGKDALAIGANTFQFFTRNPRGGRAKDFDKKDAEALVRIVKENGFGPLLAHAPYTMNASAADAGMREFAKKMMQEDLMRLEHLSTCYYNFHPGSHVKQGVKVGTKLIADMLNDILQPNQNVMVLLETMAGKGTEIGRSFQELQSILDLIELQDKVGICLDTCHVYDAGYDIVGDLDGVLAEFDAIIGLNRLKAIHLNDSKNPFESHKDRHEKIGQGSIGLEAILAIIRHPKLRHLPFFLETPNELPGYAEEIKLLRELYEEGKPT